MTTVLDALQAAKHIDCMLSGSHKLMLAAAARYVDGRATKLELREAIDKAKMTRGISESKYAAVQAAIDCAETAAFAAATCIISPLEDPQFDDGRELAIREAQKAEAFAGRAAELFGTHQGPSHQEFAFLFAEAA